MPAVDDAKRPYRILINKTQMRNLMGQLCGSCTESSFTESSPERDTVTLPEEE